MYGCVDVSLHERFHLSTLPLPELSPSARVELVGQYADVLLDDDGWFGSTLGDRSLVEVLRDDLGEEAFSRLLLSGQGLAPVVGAALHVAWLVGTLSWDARFRSVAAGVTSGWSPLAHPRVGRGETPDAGDALADLVERIDVALTGGDLEVVVELSTAVLDLLDVLCPLLRRRQLTSLRLGAALRSWSAHRSGFVPGLGYLPGLRHVLVSNVPAALRELESRRSARTS